MKKLIRLLCMLVVVLLFCSTIPMANAAAIQDPFEMPDHIHIGGCERICEESERNKYTTTFSLQCGCGLEMGTINTCEPVCNHDFEAKHKGKTFESDVCKYCGYLRLHMAMNTMPFVTRKEDVAAHSEPYEAAEVVNTISEAGTQIEVAGRVRNKYNNLWLLLTDGSYIWAGNTAFDFDSALDYTLWYTLSANGAGEDFTVIDWFASMYSGFKTGGELDYKQSDLLGLNTYDYYVLLDGEIQNERLTGEMIGNINYGYAMAAAGFSKPDTMQIGGLGGTLSSNVFEFFTSSDVKMCIYGFVPACDDLDDLIAVGRGWNYYNTARWR